MPSEFRKEDLLRSTLASITCLTDAGQESAISNAGLLYLALEQPKKALEMFRASVQLNEQRDSSWFNLAILEAEAGADNDVVLEAYGKAIAVTKSTAVASACFNNAFELLLRTRRLEEAAQWADAALQQLPQDPTAWFNVGVVMRESGNLEWAASCLEKAAHGLPAPGADADIDASAADSSSQACRAEQSRALALTTLADVHSKRGDLMSAVQCYKEATEIDPSDYESMYNMALLYRDGLMDDRHALEAFAACVALCPEHTQATFQLAAIQAGTGAGAEAAEMGEGATHAASSSMPPPPSPSPTHAPPGYISLATVYDDGHHCR
jgi:tetratricopeptide (TPR) repeat protein